MVGIFVFVFLVFVELDDFNGKYVIYLAGNIILFFLRRFLLYDLKGVDVYLFC